MSRRLVPSPALLAAPFRLRPTRPQTRSLSTPSSEVGSSSSSETLGKGERPSSYTFLPKPLYKARLALLARPLPLASPPPPDPSRLPQPSAQRSPSEPKPSMRTQPERRPRPPPTEPWAVDPAHRRPTLWGLYRDLLRAGARPGADVLRRWVRAQFREKRASGDVDVAAAYLRRGYELLETLEDPAGFERVVCRLRAYYEKQARQYATMDGFRRRNTGGPIPGGNETRGILTGRLMLATKFHRPVPRMTPQPHRLSMMIRRRREQYDKAQDVLRLRKLIQLHPGDPMLRKVGRTPEFNARVDLASRRMRTADTRACEAPSPELFARMLPLLLRRRAYQTARLGRPGGMKVRGRVDGLWDGDDV